MAKKRANGEGSIRKKPSGRWEGRYTQGIDRLLAEPSRKRVRQDPGGVQRKAGESHSGESRACRSITRATTPQRVVPPVV